MRYMLTFLTVVVFISCGNQQQESDSIIKTTSPVTDTASRPNDTIIMEETFPNTTWAHEYIAFYVENKYSEKQLAYEHVSFMTDTATMYSRAFVYARIGTNEPDRFVTHEHIYVDVVTRLIYTYDVVNDTLVFWESPYNLDAAGKPGNGQYRFDIAFAEFRDQSMGEKVSIGIMNDTITIVYEGDGDLTLSSTGQIHAKGKLHKHTSGQWIILRHPNDANASEIGGCTDGPRTVDFKKKKYKIC